MFRMLRVSAQNIYHELKYLPCPYVCMVLVYLSRVYLVTACLQRVSLAIWHCRTKSKMPNTLQKSYI